MNKRSGTDWAAMRYSGKTLKRNDAKGAGFLPMLFASLFAVMLAAMVWSGHIPTLVAMAYLVISLMTFMAYALDKSAARSGQRRTPENSLFLYGLAGGWPGAIVAQQFFRHKSSNRAFQTIFWLTVLFNCGALGCLFSPYGADVRSLLSEMI